MAEKIVIGEIDINMEKVLTDTIELKKNIALLRAQMVEQKKATGENSAEYIQYNSQLKASTSELRTHENMLSKTVQAENAEKGSLSQLRSQLSVVSAEWAKMSKEERLNTDEGKKLTKQKLDLTNQLKAEEKATGDTRRNVGNYGEALQGQVSTMEKLIPATSGASQAVSAFGVAFKVALGPLGLIIAAIASLISFFKRSEEGQNALSKAIGVFKAVLNGVMDVVGKIGEALYNAATKPKEAWQGFKDFIKGIGEFFQNTFGNVIGGSIEVFVGFLQKAFANVGLAWQKFKGIFVDNSDKITEAQAKVAEGNAKIEEGQERVKEGANNLKNAVVDAYNGMVNGAKNFIAEEQRRAAIAAKLADMQAALNKRMRAEILNDAKDEKTIAELRAKAAQKDIYDGEQRLKMIDEAIVLQQRMLADDLAIAKQKAFIHAENMKIGTKTKEDLDEQAKLEADVFNVQKANAEARRSFERQRQSAIKDMLDDQLKLAEQAVNTFNYEVEQWKIANDSKLKQAEENNRRLTEGDIQAEEDRLSKITAMESEALKKALEIKIATINARENESEAVKNAEKLKLTEDYNNAVLAKETDLLQAKHDLNVSFEETERQRKLEVLTTDYSNELQIAEDNIFSQLEIQKKQNDLKRAEEIRNAEKTGADISLIDEKYAKADEELEKTSINAKLSLASDFANNIATIAGENSKVGKAAAVAATTINTIQAAMGAYASLAPIPIVGPVLGIAAAAAAVTTGLANVKKILAVKSGLPGDTGGGDVGVSISSGGSVNGASMNATSTMNSTQTSIGQGIVSRDMLPSTQDSNPTTAILVVDDVTAKQNVEKQKVSTSTL